MSRFVSDPFFMLIRNTAKPSLFLGGFLVNYRWWAARITMKWMFVASLLRKQETTCAECRCTFRVLPLFLSWQQISQVNIVGTSNAVLLTKNLALATYEQIHTAKEQECQKCHQYHFSGIFKLRLKASMGVCKIVNTMLCFLIESWLKCKSLLVYIKSRIHLIAKTRAIPKDHQTYVLHKCLTL